MVRNKQYTKEMYKRDKNLIAQVSRFDVYVDETFEDLDKKEELLREYGYKKLKGGGELDEVEDSQLGVAFKRIYDSAVKNSGNLEGVVDLVQKIARLARPSILEQGDIFSNLGVKVPEYRINPYEWEDLANQPRKRKRFARR